MIQKSIGLHYDHETDAAPKILFKEQGEIIEKIKQMAEKYNIPLYKDDILTDILFQLKVNYEIPEYLYEVIAEIYAFTYDILKKE